MPLASGSPAPAIPGVEFSDGPKAVFFYKVTCPVCQMAAPAAQAFETAYPGRIVGVGQDPEEKLVDFEREYGAAFPRLPDLPPYNLSNSYGIEVVPTMFLVQDSTVLDTVESWDRDGYNQVSRRLAELTGSSYVEVSNPRDGLPPFRPG